ncbi:GGDEF/HD domain-containing protein [[Clostridium] sordellii]|uniref:bifunctional diguanylate cyclase/phosphohydrolase n=1 Tax=Paraclostridium sordellii TaxID=1505 RepID=UPI0005DDD322|nr:diguanylate cyclase [Paeniclostridium sordellii]CEN76709.1 GGDEF/HD domain-containing protein [[Clostridium] sordellii] [Paeniclostridium sordellii]
MKEFESTRNQKVFEILAIIKVIYILLGIVAMISSYKAVNNLNYVVASIYTAAIISLIIVYFIWLSKKHYKIINDKPKLRDNIETILLMLICTVIIVATGKESSPYKFLYVFIIIISSIQFGRNYAIYVSIICSVLVFLVDIISVDTTSLFNFYYKELLIRYFQIDIVIASAFLVTSWILGMYVNIEKEHSKELQKLANIDELTGLYNHRYFQEHLENTMSEADEKNTCVSLLFMDIDYFKNYNDINGHQAGDVVLKEVGYILKSNVRENDVVARYGGEEFAVILPDTTEEGAIKVGERIRTSIEETYFYGQESQPNHNITMSIGVSSYPLRASNKHQFINTADDALYRAKSLNKNRVEVYYSVLEEIADHIYIDEETTKSLKRFINMINKKDRYTYGHTERVVIYLGWFANYLGLNEKDKLNLKLAAYLHDMGKIEIPEEILNKKEKLTDSEYELLRQHPILGVNLVKHIKAFEELLPLIKHHHERYDGSGYPDKLSGEEIPYLARIISIADSFDAMTSHRPYNFRRGHYDAIKELRRCAGIQFDPELVEQFIKMIELKNN